MEAIASVGWQPALRGDWRAIVQAYDAKFARVYNEKWIHFALGMAPGIRTFYESTPIGQSNRDLLDVCCGTGQLALHFLEHGYRVVGVDILDDPIRLFEELR